MAGIDLERLRSFVRTGDRNVPPYFAGRANVLEDIAEAARECWRAWRNGKQATPGATRMILGAPGAGKSSLLMHLERSWCGPGGGAPAMLRLGDPADFMNGKALAERLAELLRPGRGAEIRAEIEKSWNLTGKAPGLGGVSYGRRMVTDVPDDPVNAVLAHVPGEIWTFPVVIAIDEFQTAVGDKASPQAMVLRKLHAQDYKAPVMAVLAGLSDTPATIEALGVSRRALRTAHALGSLGEDTTRDLVAGWSDRFGVPDGRWQKTVLDLARTGSFWPTHVHNTLAAFAQEIVRVKGDEKSLDMTRVKAGTEERREGYYEARMSPWMKQSELLLGAVMKGFRDGMRIREVLNLIGENADPESSDSGWHLPEGMSVRDYYRHILHHGVIEEKGMEVTAPIPSLRSWIIATCTNGQAHPDSARRGQTSKTKGAYNE